MDFLTVCGRCKNKNRRKREREREREIRIGREGWGEVGGGG